MRSNSALWGLSGFYGALHQWPVSLSAILGIMPDCSPNLAIPVGEQIDMGVQSQINLHPEVAPFLPLYDPSVRAEVLTPESAVRLAWGTLGGLLSGALHGTPEVDGPIAVYATAAGEVQSAAMKCGVPGYVQVYP
jgi:hypothetical protein